MTTTPSGFTSFDKTDGAGHSGARRVDLTDLPDSSRASGQGDGQSLGQLFASASRDLTGLVHNEIALAKAEIKDDVKHAAKGGAMFGAAVYLGLLATILLSIALAYGIAGLGLALGWAFLIVGVLYLLLAGVLALVGKKQVSKIEPPEKTIRTTKESVAALKGSH